MVTMAIMAKVMTIMYKVVVMVMMTRVMATMMILVMLIIMLSCSHLPPPGRVFPKTESTLQK